MLFIYTSTSCFPFLWHYYYKYYIHRCCKPNNMVVKLLLYILSCFFKEAESNYVCVCVFSYEKEQVHFYSTYKERASLLIYIHLYLYISMYRCIYLLLYQPLYLSFLVIFIYFCGSEITIWHHFLSPIQLYSHSLLLFCYWKTYYISLCYSINNTLYTCCF